MAREFFSARQSLVLNQMAWLANHELPRHVAYFSLAVFAERQNVARVLRNPYDLLARIDPRNDGLLIFCGQIIPGSTLLGFANTDHWDIAMPDLLEKPGITLGKSVGFGSDWHHF